MSRRTSFLAVAAFWFFSALAWAAAPESAVPKYVFLFIGDGMSVPQRMMANEFSVLTGNGPLLMNNMPSVGMARSSSANYLVTDSAASGTAIACGQKTKNATLGIDPEGNRLVSCAEVAHKKGVKVGILSTVAITHATPASFYAHINTRRDTAAIARQLVDSGFDFFGGGGLGLYGEACKKAEEYAVGKGYSIVRDRAGLLALTNGSPKTVARFSNDALNNSIDHRPEFPAIDEILKKAVEVLDGDKGFFIMCEAGRIDWACHHNDSATVLREILALEKAVRVALDFASSRPGEVLVIVTGDHETGGMTIGFPGAGKSHKIENLGLQKVSVGRFNYLVAKLFKEKKGELVFDDVKGLIVDLFGLKFSSDDPQDVLLMNNAQIKSIQKAFDSDMKKYRANVKETKNYLERPRFTFGNACRVILSEKSGVKWTSLSHTALPVMTTAQGPRAECFSGFYENDHIGKTLKSFYE